MVVEPPELAENGSRGPLGRCPVCDAPVEARWGRRKRFCNDRCRGRWWRLRAWAAEIVEGQEKGKDGLAGT